MSYTPTLTAVFAEDVATGLCNRVNDLIKRRFDSDVCPPIFRFLSAEDLTASAAVSQSILDLHSPVTHDKSKEILGNRINNKTDVCFITSFKKAEFENCLKTAKSVRRRFLKMGIEGAFNAIFLIAENLLELDHEDLTKNAGILREKMAEKNPVFNRCYFIDEINENKKTLPRKSDLTELLAIYLDAALASPMNTVIDKQFPPYFGGGNPNNANAGFSCNIVNVSLDDLKSFFIHQFARKVWSELQKPSEIINFSETAENTLIVWQENFIKSVENDKILLNISDNEEYLEKLKAEFIKRLTNELKENNFNFSGFRLFLEFTLEKWLVNLENYKADIKDKKREISERLIKNLFHKKIEKKPEIVLSRATPRKKPFCLRFRLWWRGRNNPPQTNVFKPKPAEIQPVEISVDKMTENYESRLRKINMLTDLFVFMDKICVNLDLNKENFPLERVKEDSEHSLFQNKLLNPGLSELLFTEIAEDLEEIVNFEQFPADFLEELISELGKYPIENLEKVWLRLCSQKIPIYTQQIDVLRKINELQALNLVNFFKPFWNPASVADDGFMVASWVNAGKNCFEELFSLTSSGNRILEVETEAPENIGILRINFGMDLENIISMEKKEI